MAIAEAAVRVNLDKVRQRQTVAVGAILIALGLFVYVVFGRGPEDVATFRLALATDFFAVPNLVVPTTPCYATVAALLVAFGVRQFLPGAAKRPLGAEDHRRPVEEPPERPVGDSPEETARQKRPDGHEQPVVVAVVHQVRRGARREDERDPREQHDREHRLRPRRDVVGIVRPQGDEHGPGRLQDQDRPEPPLAHRPSHASYMSHSRYLIPVTW